MRRSFLLAMVIVLVAGCSLPEPAPPTSMPVTTMRPTPVSPTPPAPYATSFDGEKARDDVRLQTIDPAGGPRYRIPGTPGNEEVARLIDERMSGLGYATRWHHFNATYHCSLVAMHNVIAERPGTSGRVVIFAAHYDTRPVADKDPDPVMRSRPVLGANDGASGVGVLLELARVLPPSNDTVRFVFFDGEDGGGAWDGCRGDWILGSTAYVASLSPAEVEAVDAFVLVDMVGDPELLLPREGHTMDDAASAAVQEKMYARGKLQGHPQFLDVRGQAILDDHVPFIEAGIPAVDLIHTVPGDPAVFPAWHHTVAADMQAVSAESLAAVGETLEAWFATR